MLAARAAEQPTRKTVSASAADSTCAPEGIAADGGGRGSSSIFRSNEITLKSTADGEADKTESFDLRSINDNGSGGIQNDAELLLSEGPASELPLPLVVTVVALKLLSLKDLTVEDRERSDATANSVAAGSRHESSDRLNDAGASRKTVACSLRRQLGETQPFVK